MKYAALSLILVTVACKSTSDGANSESKATQLAPAQAICEETCDGTFAASSLVGCVTICDSWRTERMTVVKGRSLYPLRKPAPGCHFNHTRRNADNIRPGGVSDWFSFAYQYSDGVGDGGFLIVGSGITDYANLLDFSKDADNKEIGTSSKSYNGAYLRQDAKFGGHPTFSLSSKEGVNGERKSLVVVLDDKLDPQHPFAKIAEAHFVWDKGNEQHDVVCGK